MCSRPSLMADTDTAVRARQRAIVESTLNSPRTLRNRSRYSFPSWMRLVGSESITQHLSGSDSRKCSPSRWLELSTEEAESTGATTVNPIDFTSSIVRCVSASNRRIESISSPNSSMRSGSRASGGNTSTMPPWTANSPGTSTALVRSNPRATSHCSSSSRFSDSPTRSDRNPSCRSSRLGTGCSNAGRLVTITAGGGVSTRRLSTRSRARRRRRRRHALRAEFPMPERRRAAHPGWRPGRQRGHRHPGHGGQRPAVGVVRPAIASPPHGRTPTPRLHRSWPARPHGALPTPRRSLSCRGVAVSDRKVRAGRGHEPSACVPANVPAPRPVLKDAAFVSGAFAHAPLMPARVAAKSDDGRGTGD